MINFPPGFEEVREKFPRLYEGLRVFVEAHNELSSIVGIHSAGVFAAPPTIASITVKATTGWFDVVINDAEGANLSAQFVRNLNYFLIWNTTPVFDPINGRIEHLGPGRSWYHYYGSQTLFWAAFSQWGPNSPISPVVPFGGSTPVGVAGGGAVSPPAPQPGGGSGVGGGGGGYGGRGGIGPGGKLA